jgi:catechol 2,3-dioxygenase-like lactoylglutathione lyase family enzyme
MPKLDHVAIATRDLDRSLEFYTGLLGLPLINRGEIDDSLMSDMSGESDVKVLFADIDLGGGQVLEVLQSEGMDSHVESPIGHFALAVDDIEKVYRRLIEAGVIALGKVTEIDEPGRWFGAKAAYVLDPDGAKVELIQHRIDPARESG